MKNSNKKLYVIPVIEIPVESLKYFVGKKLQDISIEMDLLRQKVKKASDYPYANNHFRITLYKKPVMTVGFFNEDITLWNFETGNNLGVFKKELTMVDLTMIKDWAKKIRKGLQRCHECGKWVKDGKEYSFAGFVCWDCYNPDVHLPPNPN